MIKDISELKIYVALFNFLYLICNSDREESEQIPLPLSNFELENEIKMLQIVKASKDKLIDFEVSKVATPYHCYSLMVEGYESE